MNSQEPRREDVEEALERVLSTSAFAHNGRQSRFLRFLVERHLQGRLGELKESVLGVEVFGRKPGYDPKADAIVRTEAIRLRARLRKYYESDGARDPLVIDLPKGGYRPVFTPRHEALPTPTLSPRRFWNWQAAGVLGAVAIALAGSIWAWTRESRGLAIVAVLPIENLGSDSNDSVADGLTDEIISNLSLIEGLTVRSRTSSFALKGKHATVQAAGSELGVDYLVEGSVLQDGGQLRVNAELIRVRDDVRLWSGRFDRRLIDLIAIQDEVSRGIVENLRLKLGAGRRHYETNVEAFDLYLRGRHAMEDFPAVGRNIAIGAIRYYQQAIDQDSTYAIAYAGMADALLAIDQNMVRPEAYTRAQAAAARAVALDPLLSEAHSAVGAIDAREYRWQQAEREFRRAIALNPNNTLAHLQLGLSVLIIERRLEEGLSEVRRAVALDPLSPYVVTELGRALFCAGRYDEAVKELRKAIALDRTRNKAYGLLGRVLLAQGELDQAQGAYRDAITHSAVPAGAPEGDRPCAAVVAGRRDEAVDILQRRLTSGVARGIAEVYACLGDEPHTMEYLERAFALHEPGLPEMVQSPEFGWLRPNPRLVLLRQKLNLPS